jgi:hypothetical protein
MESLRRVRKRIGRCYELAVRIEASLSVNQQ